MTRGRRPTRSLDAGISMAQVRGMAMQFVPGPDLPCTFMIRGSGRIIFVRVKRSARLHCGIPELAAAHNEPIARLRTLPGTGPLVRELWLYSKKGAWRYFRVTESGINETGPDGEPLVTPGKIPSAGRGVVS